MRGARGRFELPCERVRGSRSIPRWMRIRARAVPVARVSPESRQGAGLRIALALVLIAGLGLAACGRRSPIGTYRLDKAGIKKSMEATWKGSQSSLRYRESLLDSSEVTLELRAKGVAVMTSTNHGHGYQDSGTWTLHGRTLTITDLERDGTKLPSPDVTKADYDGERIVIGDPKSGMEAILRREGGHGSR
jgi:hypothetical protein